MKMPADRALPETHRRHGGATASPPRCRTGCLTALRINVNAGVHAPKPWVIWSRITGKPSWCPNARPRPSIYVNGNFLNLYVVPHWGDVRLEAVRTVESKAGSIPAPRSRHTAKIRNLMSALFNHAIRHEWTLTNPITQVRCSAKRLRVPDVLTPAEFRALLSRLEQRDRAMVLLAGSTGLQAFGDGRPHLGRHRLRPSRNYRSPVTGAASGSGNRRRKQAGSRCRFMLRLPSELLRWRAVSPYSAETDFLFPSIRMNGTQPLTPDMLLKRVIRPAAEAAGIRKRVGWHTFRHFPGDKPSRPRRRCEGGSGTPAPCQQPHHARYLHSGCLVGKGAGERSGNRSFARRSSQHPHSTLGCGRENRILLMDMVGTRRLELLTSTVSR